jgi:uncharacterized metal-binding protein YceD (DUF177 family)
MILISNFADQNIKRDTVDYLKNYSIPFISLPSGKHHFELEFNRKFFDALEYSEITNGEGSIQVDLEKQERMLIFDIMVEGWVEAICDRCLELLHQGVYAEERLFVKFGKVYDEESEDVIIIPEGSYEFELAHYIYEMINLSLPLRIVHPDDEEGNSLCDPEIIKRLEELKPKKPTDPRWDSLSGLMDKVNEN